MIKNITNVAVFAATMSADLSALVNGMVKGFVLIRNREKVKGLLMNLQRNFDESKNQFYFH